MPDRRGRSLRRILLERLVARAKRLLPVEKLKRDRPLHGASLEAAGWDVEELSTTPPLAEAADAQTKLVFADGYTDILARAEREGDTAALNVLAHLRSTAQALDLPAFSRLLSRRATLLRQWLMFFETYAVLVIPVSAELPFENHLDIQGDDAFARVWRAQMPQLGLPYLGLPALTVSTRLLGRHPSVCRLSRDAIARISV